MWRRLFLLAALFLSMPTDQLRADASPTTSGDRIVHPLAQKEMVSQSGRFVLTLTSVDNWKTPRVVAELHENRSSGRRSVWKQPLPHELGPRTAVVADSGAVLLVDESINVTSRYALTLIAPDGRRIAEYSAEQLFTVLDVPRNTISAHAKFGVWMAAQPTLAADGMSVAFSAGGRRLTVRLADGGLSVSD